MSTRKKLNVNYVQSKPQSKVMHEMFLKIRDTRQPESTSVGQHARYRYLMERADLDWKEQIQALQTKIDCMNQLERNHGKKPSTQSAQRLKDLRSNFS